MRIDLFFQYVFIAALVVLLLGCGTEKVNTIPEQMPPLPPTPITQSNSQAANTGSSVIIDMKDDGFFPKSLSISAGTTVTFVNKGNEAIWPASDNHPTHTLYPGSSIRKCNTDAVVFDACQGIPPGAAWSFRFSEKGSWGYHDHRSPGMIGVVLVE